MLTNDQFKVTHDGGFLRSKFLAKYESKFFHDINIPQHFTIDTLKCFAQFDVTAAIPSLSLYELLSPALL